MGNNGSDDFNGLQLDNCSIYRSKVTIKREVIGSHILQTSACCSNENKCLKSPLAVTYTKFRTGYFPHTAELAVINTITNELDMNMNELQQALSTDLKVDLKDLSLGVKKANRLWQKRLL